MPFHLNHGAFPKGPQVVWHFIVDSWPGWPAQTSHNDLHSLSKQEYSSCWTCFPPVWHPGYIWLSFVIVNLLYYTVVYQTDRSCRGMLQMSENLENTLFKEIHLHVYQDVNIHFMTLRHQAPVKHSDFWFCNNLLYRTNKNKASVTALFLTLRSLTKPFSLCSELKVFEIHFMLLLLTSIQPWK